MCRAFMFMALDLHNMLVSHPGHTLLDRGMDFQISDLDMAMKGKIPAPSRNQILATRP
jgi:hypothetical protein